MKKLSLHLEDLAVESFETASAEEARGTVHGHGDSADCSWGSPDYTACRASCAYACGESDECTPACPDPVFGSNGCGGTEYDSCDTACRLSCAYPC